VVVTRAMLAGLALVALTADPAVAHAGGTAGGPSELLLAGGAFLLVAGVWTVVGRRTAVLGWVAVVAGLAVGTLAFVLPNDSHRGPNATVAILEPKPGDEVPARKPVTIEVGVYGAQIATSASDDQGGHLHLYVDGSLQQMPYSTRTQVELEPGLHQVRVEYVDNQHLSFQPEIATSIELRAT
jgi:hypothetical protein